MAAVAAVRSAAGNEFLAAEAQASAAAGACEDVDVDFVDEHALRTQQPSGLLGRQHADPAAVLAVIFEADRAVHLGKQRVILAESDVEAGLEAATLLPHEDRTAGDDVAVVTLHAEALRIAVASVA